MLIAVRMSASRRQPEESNPPPATGYPPPDTGYPLPATNAAQESNACFVQFALFQLAVVILIQAIEYA